MERWLDRATALLMPLGVVIALLLCLQWPLRELGSSRSLLANDVAQSLFALYVAAALRHAGVRGAHLVARPELTAAGTGLVGTLRRRGAALVVLVWSLYLLIASTPQVLDSLRALERYPETENPGYFLVKLALLMAAWLLALQAVVDLRRRCTP